MTRLKLRKGVHVLGSHRQWKVVTLNDLSAKPVTFPGQDSGPAERAQNLLLPSVRTHMGSQPQAHTRRGGCGREVKRGHATADRKDRGHRGLWAVMPERGLWEVRGWKGWAVLPVEGAGPGLG